MVSKIKTGLYSINIYLGWYGTVPGTVPRYRYGINTVPGTTVLYYGGEDDGETS